MNPYQTYQQQYYPSYPTIYTMPPQQNYYPINPQQTYFQPQQQPIDVNYNSQPVSPVETLPIQNVTQVVKTEIIQEKEDIKSVPAEIHDQTVKFIRRGHQLVSSVLDNKIPTTLSKLKKGAFLLGLSSAINYKFASGSHFIGGHGWVNINNNGWTLLKGLAIASTAASIYLLFKANFEMRKLEEKQSYIKSFKNEFKCNATYYQQEYSQKINKAINKAEKTLHDLTNKKASECAFLALAVFSQGMMTIGALTGIGGLLGVGAIVGGTTAVGGALYLGINFFTNQDKANAKVLEKSLNKLNAELVIVNE